MSWFIAVLGCLCIVLGALALRAIKMQVKARRMQGVKLLQALRMLVKHIQIHRGISVANLGGELQVFANTEQEVRVVSEDFAYVSRIFPEIDENEDWQGLTRHWARLATPRSRLEPYDCYQQHCKLVVACLELMRSSAASFKLDPPVEMRASIYWYELLQLGELLGQLRALGVMTLVANSVADRKHRLQQKVSVNLRDIDRLFQNSQLLDKVGVSVSDDINSFLAQVEYYIVGRRGLITVTRYFNLSTTTIDAVYACFDDEMRLLQKSI